jgi:hypothetical protein
VFLTQFNAPFLAIALMLGFTSQVAGSEICADIVDYSGLPLPNSSLVATNLQTGKSFTTKSNYAGRACLGKVPEGLYSIEAGLRGFLNVRYYPVRVRFPDRPNLKFQLPFSEITEGGLGQDAILSGTLQDKDAPLEGAEVCVLQQDGTRAACTITNELGEYALTVSPGSYKGEIKAANGKVYRSIINLSRPGLYRNQFALQADQPAK